MSNLSDLLPAGAAAKQLTFTDSGSGISSKAPVILNSDGTVTEVGNASASFGSAQAFATGNYGSPASAYDPDNDRVCTVYIDADNSYYGTAVVGQISGSSITWGTPLLFESAYTPYPDIDYDTGTNQFVISFVDGSASNFLGVKTAAYAATNTLTFGSKVNGPEYAGGTAIACSSSAFLIVYDGLYGTGIAGTISGTTITLGTEVDYISSGSYQARGSSVVYDSNAGKYLIATADGNNSWNGYGFVATVTGTSISYGSGAVFDAHAINNTNSAYDSTAQKTVIAYVDLTFSNAQGVVATISGTSVSFGTVYQVIDTNAIGWQLGRQITYDARSNKTYITYTRNLDSYAYILTGTVSGTDITLSDETAYTSASTGDVTIVTDTTNNKVGLFYKDMSSTNDGTSKVYSPAGTNLTAQAFVGVADSAISASAAGSVIVQGGTVTGVNSGQGFTVGTPSAFGGGVVISYPAMAYDTVHDKMVIAYQDQNNSSYGTAVVATISGSSISYGTQVVFESAGTEHIDVCFDPDQERVIIAYRDSPNSDYGTVIVGEVSGTSITFGSPVVYSAATTQNVNCVYDTSNDKVVIVYYDVSNTELKAVVGTVSGSSISLGTPTTIVANATWPGVKAVFDSTANKVVVVYANQTSGNSDGVVGTVSGTSISFGSIVHFETSIASPLTAAYDASADKTLVVYADGGNSDYGTSVVASVSGTSISFTSPAVFETSQPGVVKSVYDATAQQTFIAYQDYSASYIGVARAVSISGTTATFSGKTTLVDPNPSPFNLGYDPDNGKSVFAFYETTGQALVTSFGDLPLTVGTKYYVTTTGGFSSSADTPSVNAGLAISTTSLLLNGDS